MQASRGIVHGHMLQPAWQIMADLGRSLGAAPEHPAPSRPAAACFATSLVLTLTEHDAAVNCAGRAVLIGAVHSHCITSHITRLGMVQGQGLGRRVNPRLNPETLNPKHVHPQQDPMLLLPKLNPKP